MFLDFYKKLFYNIYRNIASWCKGNTTDFDSVVVGSSPAEAANMGR